MKLRNFLYLNTKVIEDYIAAIDGYTYDEESQAIATSSENALTGKVPSALLQEVVPTQVSSLKKSKDLYISVMRRRSKRFINICGQMKKMG